MSEKLTACHLERRALIYLRQSSHHQLVHNTESQRLQYSMEQRVRECQHRFRFGQIHGSRMAAVMT